MLSLLCYIREYSSGTSSRDTMLVEAEYMADFVLPLREKVKKFKSSTTPRILAHRNRVTVRHADGIDSVATNCDDADMMSYLFLARLGEGVDTPRHPNSRIHPPAHSPITAYTQQNASATSLASTPEDRQSTSI